MSKSLKALDKLKEDQMATDINSPTSNRRESTGAAGAGVSGGAYGLAFIGALVYYIQHAATFWAGVLGFLKALIWPAILVYKLLELLKM